MQAYHPGFRSNINYSRFVLSDDPDTAVAQTIGLMCSYVRHDRPHFATLAYQLYGDSMEDFRRNTFIWCKRRVRFVQDHVLADALRVPHHASGFVNDVAEVLIRPVDLVRMADAQGDCDDFSMLAAAILGAGGVECVFVTLAADQKAPDQFSHVYLVAGGVPFDASHGPYVGWEAKNRFGRRQLWSVETGMPIYNAGGAGLGDLVCDELGNCYDSGGGVVDTTIPPLPSNPYVPPPVDFNTLSTLPGGGIISPTGGGGAIPGTGQGGTPWWQGDIQSAVSAALSIFKSRYAVPPPGTVITTKSGTIATGVAPGTVIGTSSSIFGQIPLWLWLVAGLGLLLLLGKKR